MLGKPVVGDLQNEWLNKAVLSGGNHSPDTTRKRAAFFNARKESMSDRIQIDPELKALIAPLSEQERSQLEANLAADGCREPITLWGTTILDGHNRYEICTRLGIPFDTVQVELADKAEAMDWMDANQLGRRNLTPEQTSLLRGRIYNRSKKPAGGTGANQHSEQNGQNVQAAPTHETVGERFGVSGKTVQRDGKFADTVEALREHVPDIDSRVMSGEVKRRDVLEAAKEPEKAEERLSHNHRAQGTGENEWYTPQHYIESARKVMGSIDLDPATSATAQQRVQADNIFTIEDDGLAQQWYGNVWLNPPYSQPAIMQFMEKIGEEVASGNVKQAVVLTHNYTDTKWFHAGADAATAICFTRGRIGFLSPSGVRAAPTQGQAFFYYGDNADAFQDEFKKYGFIVKVQCGVSHDV